MTWRRRAGFTLVEVLVALAIAALAVASLVHVVRDAFDLDGHLVAQARRADATATLFTLVDTLLATTAYEVPAEAGGVSGAGPAPPSVTGTEDAVTIWSRGPAVLGLSDRIPFTLAQESADDGAGPVVLRWRSPEGAVEIEPVLAAQSLRFRYGGTAEGGTILWQDQWSGPVAALSRIEVSIADAVTGRRSSMTAAVRPLLPRICARQPMTKGCPQWP